MSGPTARVRQIVRDRDLHMCVRCAEYLPLGAGSIHHRRPRGSGGSKRPETNLPGNLILLCGSATSPGCHQLVESRREDAYAAGLLVHQGWDPSSVPVLTHRGWLLLDDEGNWEQVEAA